MQRLGTRQIDSFDLTSKFAPRTGDGRKILAH
jgi:hypothetical protein